MPNTYNWVITQLECYPQQDDKQDVVFTIHWRRQATDGTHMADVYGTQGVTLDPAAPFTPFADLTQAMVEGWLVDAMGADRVAELDANLDKQIANLINPPVVRPPLPWSN
jgi:hypothetical protein